MKSTLAAAAGAREDGGRVESSRPRPDAGAGGATVVTGTRCLFTGACVREFSGHPSSAQKKTGNDNTKQKQNSTQ